MPSDRADVQRRDVRRRDVVRRGSEDEIKYVLALDFGFAADYTALALLEKVPIAGGDGLPTRTEIHLRYLKRFPLRTEYPDVIDDVVGMINHRRSRGVTGIVVDATGVGAPIVQYMCRCGLRPLAITITGGATANRNNVPKRDLVSRVALLLQERRLKFSPYLRLRHELEVEFANFTVRFTNKGTATFSAGGGAHDDLIIAIALGCHFFECRRRLPQVRATIIGGTDRGMSLQQRFERSVEDRFLSF